MLDKVNTILDKEKIFKVKQTVSCSFSVAVKALKDNNDDVVKAIDSIVKEYKAKYSEKEVFVQGPDCIKECKEKMQFSLTNGYKTASLSAYAYTDFALIGESTIETVEKILIGYFENKPLLRKDIIEEISLLRCMLKEQLKVDSIKFSEGVFGFCEPTIKKLQIKDKVLYVGHQLREIDLKNIKELEKMIVLSER